MIEFNDEFIDEVGLSALPNEFRRAFLGHVHDHLERSVGEGISRNMSNDQLAEFEAIIDRREDVIDEWIIQHARGYLDDELYQRIQGATGGSERELKAEYAATKWLEVNRPDYPSIVERKLTEVRELIAQHRDAILDAATGEFDDTTLEELPEA
jgi:hypothetical protein